MFFCFISSEIVSLFIDFSFTFTLVVVIRGLPVPVIACLHGMCFGGGKFEEKFCTASLFLLSTAPNLCLRIFLLQ